MGDVRAVIPVRAESGPQICRNLDICSRQFIKAKTTSEVDLMPNNLLCVSLIYPVVKLERTLKYSSPAFLLSRRRYEGSVSEW